MHLLLTAGPTREPIDPVRYLGNRSSGQMGAALASAALAAGHSVTAILGPVSIPFPQHPNLTLIHVETAAQMHAAVLQHFPSADVLIMAAAVADYRPKTVSPTKLSRSTGQLTLELEPTADIAADAARHRKPHQRIIGFSLERDGDLARAEHKLRTKNLDLIVFNPLPTMSSPDISATLLTPTGQPEPLPPMPKPAFARLLLTRAASLLAHPNPALKPPRGRHRGEAQSS